MRTAVPERIFKDIAFPCARIRIIGLPQASRSASVCNVQRCIDVVHRLDRGAHLFISQGEESFNTTYQP
jgi:hypothetical protein